MISKAEAIKTLMNKCLHCGNVPSVEHRVEMNTLGNPYDEYRISCKCGISTEFGRDVDVLLCWNGVHQENKK